MLFRSYSPLTGQVGWYRIETGLAISNGTYTCDGANISLKYLGDNLTRPEDYRPRTETFKIVSNAKDEYTFDGKRFLEGDFSTNDSVKLVSLCNRLGVSRS